jgi:hypothetical protein
MTTEFHVEWTAKYYIYKRQKRPDNNDFSTVRVFTLNEIQLFLYLNNFEILKTIDRKTYAYDTYVIVAKGDSQLFNSKSLLFKVNIANFHSNYITLRKLFKL